jgi:hypothetical protein
MAGKLEFGEFGEFTELAEFDRSRNRATIDIQAAVREADVIT